MPTIYAAWWGGPSYAMPHVQSMQAPTDGPTPGSDTDVETFSSIASAKLHFELRYANANGQTPNVTDDSEMHLWFYDPRWEKDPYPDRIIKVGPRGGVRVERA